MAPRSRSRVGTTRRDAALDAMKLMGFPEDAVRRTLKRLLNVYGPDGWAFIEADAYRVLVDEILEPNDVDQPNDQNQDDVVVRENQPVEGWVEENFGYPNRPQPSEFVNGQEVEAPVEYVQSYSVVELNPVLEPTEFGGNNIRVQEMTQQQQAAEVECAVEMRQQRQEVEPAVEYTVEHEVSSPVTQRRTIGDSGLRPFVPAVRRRCRVPRSSVLASMQRHASGSGLQVSVPASTPKHTKRASHAQVSVPAIRPSHTTRGSDSRTATDHQRRKPCFGWISSGDDKD